jgi:membrane protease YdiL (CAAX protease family)
LLLVQLTSGFPVGLALGNASLYHPVNLTITSFVAGCTLLLAVWSRSLVVGQGNHRAGVGDGPIQRWWLLVVLAFLAATWAFVASAFWSGAFPGWVPSWRAQSPWTLIAFTIVVVILAPLAEELFFRGWLWTGLRRHWSVLPTALVSCSLWLVVHMERGLLVLIALLPMAVMLGFTRHFCGVRAAIALHAVYNLVGVSVLVLLLAAPRS